MSNKLHLSMQYFAEQEPPETHTEPNAPDVPTEPPTEPNAPAPADTPPPFTAEDIAKLVDSKLTEAQKLARMSADEKIQYEREQQTADLARREQELTRRELMATAKDTLAQKGVPVNLAALLNYADAASCTKSIDLLASEYKAAVAAGVNEAMKGTTPKIGGTPSSASGLRAAMGLPPLSAETK